MILEIIQFILSDKHLNGAGTLIAHQMKSFGPKKFLAMLEGKIGEPPFFKVQPGKITVWVVYVILSRTRVRNLKRTNM